MNSHASPELKVMTMTIVMIKSLAQSHAWLIVVIVIVIVIVMALVMTTLWLNIMTAQLCNFVLFVNYFIWWFWWYKFFLLFCSYFCSLLIFFSSSPTTLLQRRASRWMQASSIIALSATYKAFFPLLPTCVLSRPWKRRIMEQCQKTVQMLIKWVFQSDILDILDIVTRRHVQTSDFLARQG